MASIPDSSNFKTPFLTIHDSVFCLGYEAGTIKAVAYDNGEEVATKAFTTADKPAKLKVSAHKFTATAKAAIEAAGGEAITVE